MRLTAAPRCRLRRCLAVKNATGNDIRQRTTIDNLTPDQIHQLGLREIDRIKVEMLAIAKQEGFADLASRLTRRSRPTPNTYPTRLSKFSTTIANIIAQMQPQAPQLFTYIPGSPVTVEAIPPFQSAMATHYQTGTPDGKRPGRVVVATADFQPSHPDGRRGHRLSRGHPRSSHAAVGGADR